MTKAWIGFLTLLALSFSFPQTGYAQGGRSGKGGGMSLGQAREECRQEIGRGNKQAKVACVRRKRGKS